MTILFVCRQNACRSQMAAGFARKIADDMGLPIKILSAGSEPAPEVNPVAVSVMSEVGVDISKEKPRLLTPELADGADLVVAVCGEEACPFIPGARYWGIEDPAGKSLEVFYQVRGIIEEKVRELLSALA